MKLLLRLAVILGLLLLLAAGAVRFGLDAALRTAIEKGGTKALGVPLSLDSIHLGLFSGTLDLGGLTVANPPDFDEGRFLTLGSAHAKVAPRSLVKDVARIKVLTLDDVGILLRRRKGRSNYGIILENLEKSPSGSPDTPDAGPSETAEDGKKFVIRRVVVRNLVAEFDLVGGVGKLASTKVTIPELVLRDVGSADGGATLPEITASIVQAILQASLEAGGQVLSPDLLKDLEARLGTLTAAGLGLSPEALDGLIEKLPISEELGEKLSEELDGFLNKQLKK